MYDLTEKIKVYYFNHLNLGDKMNKFFIEQLFGRTIELDNFTTADMTAIGSILDELFEEGIVGKRDKELRRYADKLHVLKIWGTGLIFEYKDTQKFIRPVDVYALRGKLTRETVSKAIGKRIHCTLADPGLLASLMISPVQKKYEVGIVPHYVDFELPVIEEMKNKYSNSIVINVKDDLYEVIKQIASCKCIVSSSLHGLIIADSFAIPNQWIVCSDKVLGDGYKFRDYYSAFDIKGESVDLRYEPIPDIDQIHKNYKISKADVKIKQIQLIKSFPYKSKNRLKLYMRTLFGNKDKNKGDKNG